MATRITGLSSMATRAVLGELGQAYGLRSGLEVAIRSVGGVEAARLVRAGEALDVVVLASGAMGALEDEGHLVPGSRRDVVRSSMAAAVPSGSPPPAIDTADALREAVLAAGSIGYSTGPSGDLLKGLLRGWGIYDAVESRLLQAPPGVPVGSFMARGDAALGFQQMSELLGVEGIDILGRLPAELGTDTVFTAAIGRNATAPEDARAFLAFLASADTADTKRRHGMEPA